MDDPRQQGPLGPDDPPAAGPDEAARLLRDALGEAGERWRAHAEEAEGGELRCVGPCPICRTADVIRAAAPPEFQEHWQAWQRELALALRSVLDHYIERADSRRPRAASVEDIPID
jgi:hypothetical protein